LRIKPQQIEWRRSKIIELSSQGYNQVEMAQKLQVDPSVICRDLQYLRSAALQNISEYTINELPLQYKLAVSATKTAIKEYWHIVETAKDNQEKMQALALYLDCCKGLCRWLTEGGMRLDQFLIDYGNKKEEKQQCKDGDMIIREGCSPYIYRGNGEGEQT
jgi:hypothetical protein